MLEQLSKFERWFEQEDLENNRIQIITALAKYLG